VRLGLLLSEIGQANGVVVTAQEMEMLIRQAAQQYREQDRQRFVDYVRSEPLAAAQLRAPLYEDKVVDFLFDKAEVTEREVTREELQAAIEAEEGEGDVKPAKKKAAKAAEGDAEAKPAKKKAAKKAAPKAKPKRPKAKPSRPRRRPLPRRPRLKAKTPDRTSGTGRLIFDRKGATGDGCAPFALSAFWRHRTCPQASRGLPR
jgi:trigger factor